MNHTDPRNGYYGLFANASERTVAGSRDEDGKDRSLATREEPEASLSRTWKPFPKGTYPKYQSCQKVSHRHGNQSIYLSDLGNEGSSSTLCHGSIESCDQQ
jgi:hypothetical protein